MCTGNEIKSTPGDAADCSADTPWDGDANVPNKGHTACGEYFMCFAIIRSPNNSIYENITVQHNKFL